MKSFLKRIVVKLLTIEAKLLLKKHQPTIVAIAGSVGKTSTKDAIFAALKDSVHARKSQKSFNSDIGVPLTVLGLQNGGSNPLTWLKNLVEGAFIVFFTKEYPEVLVLETGVDQPGDMQRLTSWIKPDIVVITRLPDVPVHVEAFPNKEALDEEELGLVHALKVDGTLIYNHDDERILQAVEEVRQPSFGYGRYAPTHFTAGGDRVFYDGSVPVGVEFSVTHLNETIKVQIQRSIGVQHTYSNTAALAVAHQFDIDLALAAQALSAHYPPPGRMRLVRGAEDTLIIDDTYNASPVATERALQTFKELKVTGRKILVMSDMLELGQYSVREHERVGEDAAEVVDHLYTFGLRSRKVAEAALEHGMSEKVIWQYENQSRLMHELRERMEPGDAILIKGSQSMRMEKVVEFIMAEPERAGELLVRQDKFWKSR